MDWLTRVLPKRNSEGTERAVEIQETLRSLLPKLSAMGITRVADITGLDRIGIPVAMAVRPNSRSLSTSQGKGASKNYAFVSAIMESVESFHAERISLPLVLGSLNDFTGKRDVADVMNMHFSTGSQFHPDFPLLWIEGRDILSDSPKLVPFELVHTNFTRPHLPGSGCFFSSTNGLASGNHRLEATLHAVYELIERHSSSKWFMRTLDLQRSTRIDPSSITDQSNLDLLRKLWDSGMDVAIWDVTSEAGVAAFHCFIADKQNHSLHSAIGMGCHANRSIALHRAITEAAQSRVTVIAGAREDISRSHYSIAQDPKTLIRDRNQIASASQMRDIAVTPNFESDTFNQDLDRVLTNLQNIGIREVIVIDLSCNEIQIPVVRVVIPGLEGLVWEKGYKPRSRVGGDRNGA